MSFTSSTPPEASVSLRIKAWVLQGASWSGHPTKFDLIFSTLPFATMVSFPFLNKPSMVLTQGLVTCYILKLKHSFFKYSMVPHVKLTIYNSTLPLIIAPSSKIATSYFLPKKVREQTTEIPGRKAFQVVGIANVKPKGGSWRKSKGASQAGGMLVEGGVGSGGCAGGNRDELT